MTFYYLKADDVRTINIAYCGAGAGVRDENGFLGVIDRPSSTYQGLDLFPGPFDKAAAYLHGFATTQYFNDGNKRTGFLSATVFLSIHGHNWLGPDAAEAESFLLDVAAKRIEMSEVATWLQTHTRPLEPAAT